MADLSEAQVIYFNRGEPSNFYPAPIEMPHPFRPQFPPHRYLTNEHRFQAMKGRTSSEHDHVASAPDAFEAKRRGRALKLTPAEIYVWNHYRALPVMLEACLVKFQVVDSCRRWLLSTGDAWLVEHRRDAVWGDGLNGTGKNQLGHVLMLVRRVITEQ